MQSDVDKANPPGAFSRAIDTLEESIIAVLLGLMTIVTFANVVARYVFNDNILWALELTVFMFAWLVLLGASYGVKKSMHIGVDVVVNAMPPAIARAMTFLAWLACVAFAALLLKGSWDYWVPFLTERAWFETNDIPMPAALQFLSDWVNEGERYEKVPKLLPYLVLPLSMALLLYRFLQTGWRILRGEQSMLIAGHEAEEMLEELQKQPAADRGV
ncbi:MAG: TRAP transporter small permease [Burkholderiaceae bacterium]